MDFGEPQPQQPMQAPQGAAPPINEGLNVISKVTDKISEKNPASNILYFGIAIALILLLIWFYGKSEGGQINSMIYVVGGFGCFISVVYLAYQLVMKYFELKATQLQRMQHNVVYREMKSGNVI